MQYEIKSNKLSVTVDSVGAQLCSVEYCGKQRLWQNENGSWADYAPVLFPVCGQCNMTVDGKVYPMPKHGIVRHANFYLASQSKNSLTFVTCSNEQTLAQYPFDFEFAVTYTVKHSKLIITYTVTNNCVDRSMPFSCGTHVSFALPSNPQDYQVDFSKEDVLHLLQHTKQNYLTGKITDLGIGKTIKLTHDLLDDDRCIILRYPISGKVTLRNIATKQKVVSVKYDDYPHLLLWHSIDSNMICIEPWHNLPDTEGDTREFAVKDGVAVLPAKATQQIKQIIKYY